MSFLAAIVVDSLLDVCVCVCVIGSTAVFVFVFDSLYILIFFMYSCILIDSDLVVDVNCSNFIICSTTHFVIFLDVVAICCLGRFC